MPDPPQQAMTLAILAGGEGARMGKPKAEIEINGKPILRYLLERFRWPGPTLLVTAPGRDHPPSCEDFDREVSDACAGQGPLRGIYTALEHATTPIVIVTTVDMPCVEALHFKWLAAQLIALPELLGVMFRRGSDAPRIEPFPCALRRDGATVLAARLRQKQLSVQSLSDLPNFALLPVPIRWGESMWQNLNRPEDLSHFMRSGLSNV